MRATNDRHLYQHGNGTYYALLTVSGHTEKKSLKTKNLKQARQRLLWFLQGRDILSGKAAASSSAPCQSGPPASDAAPQLKLQDSKVPFVNALGDFCEGVAFRNKSTARNFATQKTKLLAFMGTSPTWELFKPATFWKSHAGFSAGEGERSGPKAAPNQFRWFLRKFAKYCESRRLLDPTTIEDIRGIPGLVVPPRRVRLSDRQALEDLFSMIEAEDKLTGLFLRWVLYTGLRLEGARGVTWEQIDLDQEQYRCVMKGGTEVVLPLTPKACDLLRKLKLVRLHAGEHLSGLVFEISDRRYKSALRMLKKYSAGLDLDAKCIHAFRHLFASYALQSGFSPAEVAVLLGHRDGGVLVCRVYGHVSSDNLKSKLKSLHFGSGEEASAA